MQSDAAIEMLNTLIQVCEDNRIGFAAAARQATLPELQGIFQERSIDCASATAELQRLVVALGGKPETAGTIAGAAHRGWARVMAMAGNPDTGMLDEAGRAEEAAQAAYGKALSAPLPPMVHAVVQTQHAAAARNYELMCALRENYRAVPPTAQA